MGFPYRSYDLALRALGAVSPAASLGGSKVARGIRGRRGALAALEGWAAEGRKADRSLAWFHAPSVGEGLQARAVLEALRAARPDVQTAFTHFSPSAEGLAGRMPADVATYLPWDTRPSIGRALAALRPDLLVFTKTEVWPMLAREAARGGAGVVLAAATLPANAGRLRGPAPWLLRPVFGALDRVLSIADDDAERFGRLGVQPERVQVTGDPAIDSAATRALAADPRARYLAPFGQPERSTVVAGSTWEPDEAVLVPAAAEVRRKEPSLRLVIAPHEPTPAHLDRLDRELDRAGWRTARLATVEERGEAGDADAILVDRVGVLAHLYTIGHAAYVGGGFHRHGLHSVLEPAAAGIPITFGPGHANARAAGDLIQAGGAWEVPDAAGLARALSEWFESDELRREAGEIARGYIQKHLGAAERTARALADLLPPAGAAGSSSAAAAAVEKADKADRADNGAKRR